MFSCLTVYWFTFLRCQTYFFNLFEKKNIFSDFFFKAEVNILQGHEHMSCHLIVWYPLVLKNVKYLFIFSNTVIFPSPLDKYPTTQLQGWDFTLTNFKVSSSFVAIALKHCLWSSALQQFALMLETCINSSSYTRRSAKNQIFEKRQTAPTPPKMQTTLPQEQWVSRSVGERHQCGVELWVKEITLPELTTDCGNPAGDLNVPQRRTWLLAAERTICSTMQRRETVWSLKVHSKR